MKASDPAKRTQPDGPVVAVTGLRERKKQKTREAIQRVALRLFEKQGYDETTIEEIAAAVEISPSTFFNYFPSKEDVVLLDAYDPLVITLFKGRPKDEPLNVAFRRVLGGMADVFERDKELVLARGRLFMDVPELRGRIWDEMERTQTFVTRLLAERTGRNRDDFELRVTARIVIAAIYEAGIEWMRRGGRARLVDLAERALDIVESGARLGSATNAKRSKRAGAIR